MSLERMQAPELQRETIFMIRRVPGSLDEVMMRVRETLKAPVFWTDSVSGLVISSTHLREVKYLLLLAIVLGDLKLEEAASPPLPLRSQDLPVVVKETLLWPSSQLNSTGLRAMIIWIVDELKLRYPQEDFSWADDESGISLTFPARHSQTISSMSKAIDEILQQRHQTTYFRLG